MSTLDPTISLGVFRRRWVRTVLDTYSFGMYTVIAVMTLYHLFRRGNAWSQHRITIGYTIAMMAITAGWYYSQTRMDEAESIETLAGPSLSHEIAVGNSCTPLDYLSTILSLLQFWGNDLLMLSRAYTIFGGSWYLMAVPSAMFLAFVSLGLILVASCAPTFSLSDNVTNNIALAHYSLSAVLNVLITGMIATKLLLHRRNMRQQGIGGNGSIVSNVYLSAIGVLAESAALYSASLIIYVILLGRGSIEVLWFSAMIMSASFLSQAWIILRIAMGSTYIRTGATGMSSTTVAQSGVHFVRAGGVHAASAQMTTTVGTFTKRDDMDTSMEMNDFKV